MASESLVADLDLQGRALKQDLTGGGKRWPSINGKSNEKRWLPIIEANDKRWSPIYNSDLEARQNGGEGAPAWKRQNGGEGAPAW